MDKNLLVQIFVSTGVDEGEIATGYPIAKNRILTARHALYPDGQQPHSIEVRWCHLTGSARSWRPATFVEWDGSDEFDVALIECEFPEKVDRLGIVSEGKLSNKMHWCSAGFARAGERDDGECRSVGMKGEVFSMADSEPEFELGAKYEVSHDEQWKGASGSPVFVGDKIIGVIVSCPENFDARRLRATPLWKLLQEPGFCEAIGYGKRKERLAWARRELTSILKRSTEATEKLADRLRLDTRLGQNRAENLAEALLNHDIEQILDITYQVAKELLQGGNKPAVDAVRQVMSTILPAIFDHGIIESVRTQKSAFSCVTVSLPIATKTVTEIVMAGVDRRAAKFHMAFDIQKPEKRRLEAAFRIELPPEVGLDRSRSDFINAFHRDLIGKCGVEDDLVPNQRVPDKELIKSAAEESEARSEEDGQTYYYIYALPAHEMDHLYYTDGIKQLKNCYPSVVFINLTGAAVSEERSRFRPYRKILETTSV
ncbi:MAG: hypothetical protein GY807_09605 [Gammaproteobacteria bacterium]|nr:hypothetical protein [Gammaproteobacteria bacterium]